MKPFAIGQAWNQAEKCQQCGIRELVLFADLQRDDFNLLHLPIDDIELQAGDFLYKEKEAAKFVYTIRSGLLKQVRYLANGSYRVIRLLRQGDLAGIEALNGLPYLHHTITLQDTSVCRIPVEDIEQLNHKSSHLYKRLTTHWQKVQNDADIWLTELTVGNSRKRVANLLIYLASNSANDSFYLPTREDIGALLAITTETASRIIAEFKRLGLLQTQRYTAKADILKLKQIS
jgi:CRP-like cAMP-binding protein